MSLEFRREVYAEKINFGFLSLCIMFKVMRRNKILEKMIVGRKGMKTKDQILQRVNIKYQGNEKKPAEETKKELLKGKSAECLVLESK